MIAKFFPWYSEITRPQKNALFSAWLGYVFDGFDFMLIFYIMYLIKADLGLTDMEGHSLPQRPLLGDHLAGRYLVCWQINLAVSR